MFVYKYIPLIFIIINTSASIISFAPATQMVFFCTKMGFIDRLLLHSFFRMEKNLLGLTRYSGMERTLTERSNLYEFLTLLCGSVHL